MTGAPIYLVSACASGEEFVAAFRRYADKNGLFVPIREPLPIGGRSRFAVTLRDGGVMIEGEAEIISSARTASVLHGRVGMTLRFVDPDTASKTMLGELEKARLAMRPAPPSVSPRPAEIPAEPRPVPPPVQGRIDAVNALAECVAIGDTSGLGPPLPPAPAAPPKAGPRFVAAAQPATGLGVATRTSAPPRPVTAPIQVVMPTPDRRDVRDTLDDSLDARPPSITPRATPQPEALRKGRSDPDRSAVVPTVSGLSQTATAAATSRLPEPPPPGPSSDTIVAATPPAPPASSPPTPTASPAPPSATTSNTIAAAAAAAAPPAPSAAMPQASSVAAPTAPRRAMEMPVAVPRAITRPGTPAPEQPVPPVTRAGPISTTMTAVPVPTPAVPQSAPTEIGGPIVEPLPPLEAEAEPVSDSAIEIVASTAARDDASARTQIHAGAPRPQPLAPSSLIPAARPLMRGRTPVAPTVGSARPTLPEVEIAEPTDLWEGPPEPTPSLDPEDSPAPVRARSLEDSTPPEESASLGESALHDAGASQPRRTVIGVVVTPPGVTVLPAPAQTKISDAAVVDRGGDSGDPEDILDGSLLASEEPTGSDRRVVGDSANDGSAPILAPEPQSWPTGEPPAPSTGWTMRPALLAGRAAPGDHPPSLAHPVPPASPAPLVVPAPAAGPDAAPPRSDWIMPPSRLAGLAVAGAEPGARTPPAGIPAGPPSGDWTIALDPQAPDGWSEPLPVGSPRPPGDEPLQVHPPLVANPHAPGSPPRHHPGRPDEIPAAEPKVQIDPTLIEPLRPLPPDGVLRPMPSDGPARPVPPEELFRHPAASSQDMPSYAAPPVAATSALAMDGMMTMPQQPAFMGQPGTPLMHPGQVPPYPMDAAYQVVPVGMPPPRPSAAGSNNSGFADPRYPIAPASRSSGRRHAIIVIASALVAVVIGIIVLLVLGGRREPGPADSGSDPRGPAPVHAPGASAIAPVPAPSTSANPSPAHGDTAAGPAEPPSRTVAAPADPAAVPPESLACFVSVTSQPPGAEIVIADTNVLGTTPQKIELPCGSPTELMIRKARMVSVTRTVMPTPEGVTLKVVLGRLTFLVKVSSTPAGATVTVNGKPLGVTPTTVKLPAFEASTLTLTRDGYTPETERVTPKASGTAVHTVLKRLDPRKPR